MSKEEKDGLRMETARARGYDLYAKGQRGEFASGGFGSRGKMDGRKLSAYFAEAGFPFEKDDVVRVTDETERDVWEIARPGVALARLVEGDDGRLSQVDRRVAEMMLVVAAGEILNDPRRASVNFGEEKMTGFAAEMLLAAAAEAVDVVEEEQVSSEEGAGAQAAKWLLEQMEKMRTGGEFDRRVNDLRMMDPGVTLDSVRARSSQLLEQADDEGNLEVRIVGEALGEFVRLADGMISRPSHWIRVGRNPFSRKRMPDNVLIAENVARYKAIGDMEGWRDDFALVVERVARGGLDSWLRGVRRQGK